MHLWGEADLCLVFGPDWKSSLLLVTAVPRGVASTGSACWAQGMETGPAEGQAAL